MRPTKRESCLPQLRNFLGLSDGLLKAFARYIIKDDTWDVG